MNRPNLNGQAALVTGASLGIGRAAAIALAQAGAQVAVNYRQHAEAADEVVQCIHDAGGEAIAVAADVADDEQVEKMVAQVVRRFGHLSIAVSNAAYSERETFYEADMAGFRRTVDVTMWGAFHTLRASARQMVSQGDGGAIVLVSSPHAYTPVPRSMAYNLSKAAVEQMSRTAAIELAEHRIRVNVLQPGWTDTPGERKFASEETLQNAGPKIPLGRLGTPEEMAQGLLFFCDPDQSYVTGSALLIDGGITLPWWANRGSAAPE